MDTCRSCKAKIKPQQIYCPECGEKLPILGKEEIRDFRKFKSRFKPVFFAVSIILLIFLILLIIKISDPEVTFYKVKESLSKLKPVGTSSECVEEDFLYSIDYVKSQVFADVLKVECSVENLEGEQGIFEYTAEISDKLSMEENQRTSELLLGPYETKTVSIFFKDVKSPNKVDYFCKVTPPKKRVCKTETEHVLVTEEEEKIKIKKEESHKSLFELILEKIG